MTEQFNPWISVDRLVALLQANRCADIERRLRQGAALGEIRSTARIAKVTRYINAEWEPDRTREEEHRNWDVPASVWNGFHRVRLSIATNEYYSGPLIRSDDFGAAFLIGVAFDRQQALEFFGVEQPDVTIDVERQTMNAPATLTLPQIRGTLPSHAKPADRKNEPYAHSAAELVRGGAGREEAFRQVMPNDPTRQEGSIIRGIRTAFDLMYKDDGQPR